MQSESTSSANSPYFPHSFHAKIDQGDYKELPKGWVIKRVIILHRHGDRSQISRSLGENYPEHPEITKIWEEKLPKEPVLSSLIRSSSVFGQQKGSFVKFDSMSQYNFENHSRPYGQLTEKGVFQLYELGNVLRDRYFRHHENIPIKYWREKCYMRSTGTHRTQLSLRSLIHGMKNLPLGMEDMDEMEAYPHIVVNHGIAETMHPADGVEGSLLHTRRREVLSRIESIDQKEEKEIQYKMLLMFTRGLPWMNIKEVLTCLVAHDLPLPKVLSKEDEQFATNVLSKYFGSLFKDEIYNRFSMGRFYRDILGDWEKNRSSSMGDCTFYEEDDIDIHSLPFLQIYSCHDTSLIPVMCGFGLYDDQWTPYGSYLAFEIVENMEKGQEYVRTIYNNKMLSMRINDNGDLSDTDSSDTEHPSDEFLCPCENFLQRLKKLEVEEDEFESVVCRHP